MNQSQEFKGTYINRTELTESVVTTSVWVPSQSQQRQSTYYENMSNNSILRSNSPTTNNKTYKSEIIINQTPTTSLDDTRCDKCKGLIDDKNGNEILFNNRYYHINCFKCSNCQSNLNISSNKKFKIDSNGQPICYQCELSQSVICFNCHKIILEGEIITFDKNDYHKNCFNCGQCTKSLISENNLRIHNSKVCCFQCYSQYFAPRCEQCFQPISIGKQTNFNGKIYHSDCFRCGQCNEIINDEQLSTYNSKPCCVKCYNKYVAPQCFQCLKAITGERSIIYNENKYHPECFRCEQCNEIINDEQFSTYNNKPYCVKCYKKYFAPKCEQCFQPISNEKYNIFNGNKYHLDCFRCGQCNEIINDEQLSTYNNKPCCVKCYKKYVAPQCFQCLKAIIGERCIIYNENKYHPECFRCIKCNEILNDSEFHRENGKPCCIECFNKYFAEKCYECLKIISVGKRIRFDGKSYHPDCFRCDQCKTILTNSKLNTKNGKPCCIQCYDDYSTIRCQKCSKPILDKYTTFKGNNYHLQCFVCDKCNRIIESRDKFYNGDLGTLCSTCAI